MAKLIHMVRDESHGKPLSADVHPDEVANFEAAGFVAEGFEAGSAPPSPSRLGDDPLDHDGDGTAGGSVSGYHATAAKGARKAKRKGKAK